MHPRTLQPRILALADRVGRLTISRHDPEAFFSERSELEAELRRLGENLTRDCEVHQALQLIKRRAAA